MSQCLWCAAFRPWALETLWLSALMLATTALCLYSSLINGKRSVEEQRDFFTWYWPSTFPRSLHLGWVCAATLVNINAWVGYSQFGPDIALTAAVLSVLAASGVASVFIYQGFPTAAVAIAWGLTAVSYGTATGSDVPLIGDVALTGLALAYRTVAVAILVGAFVNVVEQAWLHRTATTAQQSSGKSSRRTGAGRSRLSKPDATAMANARAGSSSSRAVAGAGTVVGGIPIPSPPTPTARTPTASHSSRSLGR
mmetsp:Transcript_85329/g.241725  ORF Transcript_85329/g.241725 Transcript_85329/m.241725 type:complete len:253 (+) Transcript_85329:1442-2200(+)